MAGVAHFSAYRFRRLFSACMGETLGDYLRHRQVEIAAMRLAAPPRITILTIALSVGFGLSEAFARALKNRFRASPTAWPMRQMEKRGHNSNPSQLNREPNQAPRDASAEYELSSTQHTESHMNAKLIERQPVFSTGDAHLVTK